MSMLDLTGPIRTLGLYQPYAGLMLHGKLETRFIRNTRKPPFPLGTYLIYSTKKSYTEATWMVLSSMHVKRIREIRHVSGNDCHALGKALCVADLVEIIDPLLVGVHDEAAMVDIRSADNDGRLVGLRFENVLKIEPFVIQGKQGVGLLTPAEKAKIVLCG